jgi:YggT family protein
MGQFLYIVIDALLAILQFAIIANAILSWLVAFDVINLRNRFAYSVAHFLDAVTRPVLRPFQRFIPPLGGVDVTPIIVLILIQAARSALLPWLFRPLIGLLGG